MWGWWFRVVYFQNSYCYLYVIICNSLSVIVWNQTNACRGFCVHLNWFVFQVQTDVGIDTKHQTLQGVAFPIAKEAIQALEKLKNKKLNYVQLASIKYFNYSFNSEYKIDYLYIKQCALVMYTDKLPFCIRSIDFLVSYYILWFAFCILTIFRFALLTANWYEKRNYYFGQHTSHWTEGLAKKNSKGCCAIPLFPV